MNVSLTRGWFAARPWASGHPDAAHVAGNVVALGTLGRLAGVTLYWPLLSGGWHACHIASRAFERAGEGRPFIELGNSMSPSQPVRNPWVRPDRCSFSASVSRFPRGPERGAVASDGRCNHRLRDSGHHGFFQALSTTREVGLVHALVLSRGLDASSDRRITTRKGPRPSGRFSSCCPSWDFSCPFGNSSRNHPNREDLSAGRVLATGASGVTSDEAPNTPPSDRP